MKKKTYLPNQETDQTQTIDAKGQILGRLASKIAIILRGKNKPQFAPNKIVGDKVEVINAKFIVTTGTNKKEQKIYYKHTGYIGHLKTVTLKEMLKKNPDQVIERAVYGMLPGNKLRRELMKRLTVYPDHKG